MRVNIITRVTVSRHLKNLVHGKVCATRFNAPAGDPFRAIRLAGGHVICTTSELNNIIKVTTRFNRPQEPMYDVRHAKAPIHYFLRPSKSHYSYRVFAV